jgi:hypothetical protein
MQAQDVDVLEGLGVIDGRVVHLDGSVYGQRPTKMGGGSFTKPVAGTGQDVRYTRAKDTSAVYAIFLGWPGNGTKVSLTGFNSSRLKMPSSARVQLMGATPGTDVNLTFSQDANGLNVTFPSSTPFTALAYVVRVQLKTPVGVESPIRGKANVPLARFERGILTLPDLQEGAVRILDIRGQGKTFPMVSGRVQVGDLAPGVYRVQVVDGVAGTHHRAFTVIR